MEMIRMEGVGFTYSNENRRALKDIQLSIRQGELVLIAGTSGCGKTTLLRLLKRELTPAGKREGSILYQGTETADLDAKTAASQIGYVMQNPEQQIVTDKVWHELAFGLENMGVPGDEIRRRVGEMAQFFGIHPWFHKKTAQLSGGQKQLLNLASIMVMQPKVLILDEPTSQLDPIAASEFIGTIQKLNRELGITVIIVEHRLEEVFSIADRVVFMEQGTLVLSEPPRKAVSKLRQLQNNLPLLKGLPSAVQISHQLGRTELCPLTVKEGQQFLMENYKNDIRVVGKTKETLSKSCEYAVEVKGVHFRYAKELPDQLAGVDLNVAKAEVVSILGGNGSGKTTLLNILSGQKKAHRGIVRIAGKKIQSYKANELYKQNVALLPQNPQTVFVKMTVREDYQELQKVMEETKDVFDDKIEKTAEILGIQHLLHKHPFDLSGGEQQKAALGKLLLQEPKLLLLDEPTKGIDAQAKSTLCGILKQLKEKGITILLVTHDVEFAAEISDTCCLLFDGQILSTASPRKFFSSNSFYTTAASRIARNYYDNAITNQEIVALCRKNGRKHYE